MRGISIIMPVYNEEGNVRSTVNSILEQSYKNYELIIVDDGSTDNCIDEIKSYSKGDGRVIVLKKNNEGISRALNYGLKQATGEYIARVDAGDVASPTWLDEQLANIESSYDLVFGRVLLCNQQKKGFYIWPLLVPGDVNKSIIKGRVFPHSFLLGKRSVFMAYGGYPHRDGVEDYVLWKKMAQNGCKLGLSSNIQGVVSREGAHAGKIRGRLGKRFDKECDCDNRLEIMVHEQMIERLIIYNIKLSDAELGDIKVGVSRWPLYSVKFAVKSTVKKILFLVMWKVSYARKVSWFSECKKCKS